MNSQPSLLDLPQTKLVAKVVRTSLTDKLAALFLAHPGEWLDARTQLMPVGGFGGWRTRISELHLERGMRFENRWRDVRLEDGRTYRVSEYKFVPEGH